MKYADIKARYAYMTVEGIEYRIYIEEAGTGIPVLLQHTAGSDGRQWRHLLEDPELTKRFRFIACDLPYHGKSIPPLSERYWEEEYKLKTEWFMNFTVTLVKEMELKNPIFMGCSMGGHLAPDLALHHPGIFKAVIGLEAAASSAGVESLLKYLWHPEISNESKPAMMRTLCSPTAPEPFVRETIWCYSQGAPVVFKGDLYYYMIDHDLTETAKDIDTSQTAVYILNGEYDWSGFAPAGEALANDIKGAKWTFMKGLGHFPMCEDPEQFKSYIEPILDEISSTINQ